MDEDGTVIEEQEQFAELASNEFLLQQLRSLLDTGAREMLEELPDGIHSGLARDGEKGMFFYFTAPGLTGEGRRHFWRYYDIGRDRVVDNRFLIANLISCSMDTPRVTGDCDVFSIQGKVIDDILGSVREQQAVEAAPRILDPLQQTVITPAAELSEQSGRKADRSQGSDAAPAFPNDPRRHPRPATSIRAVSTGTRTSCRSLDVCLQWMQWWAIASHPDPKPANPLVGKTCTWSASTISGVDAKSSIGSLPALP